MKLAGRGSRVSGFRINPTSATRSSSYLDFKRDAKGKNVQKIEKHRENRARDQMLRLLVDARHRHVKDLHVKCATHKVLAVKLKRNDQLFI